MYNNNSTFGIKTKSLITFSLVFLLMLSFNVYLGNEALNQVKEASKEVGQTVQLQQSERYYRDFTDSQNQTIELLIKSIEDDVINLKNFTTRVYNNPELFNTDKYWRNEDHLTHLPNNQLIDKDMSTSTLWSPTWMNVTDQVLKRIETSAFLNEHFVPILQRNENTVANYFLGKEGFVRYFPRINMLSTFAPDHRTIDDIYFAPANEQNNPEKALVWTSLYQDPAGKGLMISAIAPIYLKEEFIGVVGTDITLQRLVNNYIKHDQVNGNFSLLLDQNFRPIALPQKAVQTIYGQNLMMDDKQVPLSLLEFNSPFQAAFNKMKAQDSGFEKVELADETLYISYNKFNRLNWIYADVVGEQHLLNATKILNTKVDTLSKRLILDFGLPSIIFFIVLLLFIIGLLNHLLSPILKLSNISKTIAQGQTEHPIDIKASDEIAQLVENFKAMQSAVIKQKQSLEQKVDLRTQALENAYTELLQANKKASQSAADITMLSKLGRELTATLDLEAVFEKTYQNLNDVIETHAFTLGFVDYDKGVIDMPLVVEEQKKLPGITLRLDEINRPAVWCVLNQKELLMFDEDDDKKYFKDPAKDPVTGKRHKTVVYQPLMIGDDLIGCLSVQNSKANAFNEEQVELIRIMAGYLAIALANALGYSKLEKTHEELLKTQQQLVLQEKMASMGTLTQGVAHELSNPTNFVHIGAHNLNNDLIQLKDYIFQLAGDSADPTLLESINNKFTPFDDHIGSIEKGALRIKAIVDDLRAFTNIQDSEITLLDLTKAINTAVNSIKSQLNQDIDFELSLAQEIELNCKSVQINQVLINIIQNAVDAISQKLSQSHDESYQGKVSVSAEATNNGVLITIKDNGIGMDEPTQRKIFEPFYSSKTFSGGTGLGLAVTFAIINNHGGQITVNSNLDKGSVFCVFLPYDNH